MARLTVALSDVSKAFSFSLYLVALRELSTVQQHDLICLSELFPSELRLCYTGGV